MSKVRDWQMGVVAGGSRYSETAAAAILAKLSGDLNVVERKKVTREIEAAALIYCIGDASSGKPPPADLERRFRELGDACEKLASALDVEMLPGGVPNSDIPDALANWLGERAAFGTLMRIGELHREVSEWRDRARQAEVRQGEKIAINAKRRRRTGKQVRRDSYDLYAIVHTLDGIYRRHGEDTNRFTDRKRDFINLCLLPLKASIGRDGWRRAMGLKD